MPQMKPMNWIFLYLFLNSILTIMNIMNYFFMMNMKIMKTNSMKKKNNLNWKW